MLSLPGCRSSDPTPLVELVEPGDVRGEVGFPDLDKLDQRGGANRETGSIT